MENHAFPFKAVIFDMDGVIVDTEKFYFDTLAGLFDAAGIDVPREALCSAVGSSYQDFRKNLVSWYALGGEHISEDEGLARYNAWEAKHEPDYAALLNPGVAETIAELKRGACLVLSHVEHPRGPRRLWAVRCLRVLDERRAIPPEQAQSRDLPLHSRALGTSRRRMLLH